MIISKNWFLSSFCQISGKVIVKRVNFFFLSAGDIVQAYFYMEHIHVATVFLWCILIWSHIIGQLQEPLNLCIYLVEFADIFRKNLFICLNFIIHIVFIYVYHSKIFLWNFEFNYFSPFRNFDVRFKLYTNHYILILSILWNRRRVKVVIMSLGSARSDLHGHLLFNLKFCILIFYFDPLALW